MLVEIELVKDPSKDGEVVGHLDKMIRTTNSIQDQITFTKYYQEIGSQVPTWHLVPALVRHAMGQLDTKGITTYIRFDGLKVFAYQMIGKVFFNHIDNALKHGDHVTRIAFFYCESGSGLVIVAEDNGCGIQAADKPHIFSKGFRCDSGLGLFLIAEILFIIGMTIVETGEVGKEARFEITVKPIDYQLGQKQCRAGTRADKRVLKESSSFSYKSRVTYLLERMPCGYSGQNRFQNRLFLDIILRRTVADSYYLPFKFPVELPEGGPPCNRSGQGDCIIRLRFPICCIYSTTCLYQIFSEFFCLLQISHIGSAVTFKFHDLQNDLQKPLFFQDPAFFSQYPFKPFLFGPLLLNLYL